MKQGFLQIIKFLTRIISYIVPIDKRLLVFHSTPNYGDNSYAVFQYLIDNYPNKYKYVWLVDNDNQKDIIIKDLEERGYSIEISIQKRKSIKSIFSCFRAYKIFNTVGLFVHICFHQDKRINMWHGMPLKRIYSEEPNGDYTIATSEIFVEPMAEGLNIKKENVLILGQPRNDMLFHPEKLPKQYASLLQGYSKKGIWMPTFRRSHVDTSYSDGEYLDNHISFLSFSELEELNTLLIRVNGLLIIKLHPLDILQTKDIGSYSNILILKNDNFEQRYMYSLLAHCDYLLSDFSSVVVDYEILNRPIGIVANDYEKYRNSRGVTNIKIPGKPIKDKGQLYDFIISFSNSTLPLQDYDRYYNLFKDDKSTQRLLRYFKLIN